MDILLTACVIIAMSYISDYFELPSTFLNAIKGWLRSKNKREKDQDNSLSL